MITKKEIDVYEFCKDHYYCDPYGDGERMKWEPFENWDDEDIEAQIETDVCALQEFFGKDLKLIKRK